MRPLILGFACLAIGCSSSTFPTTTGSTRQQASASGPGGVGSAGNSSGGLGVGSGTSGSGHGGSTGGGATTTTTGASQGNCPSGCFGQFPVCNAFNTCVQCNQGSDCSSGVCEAQFCLQCDDTHACQWAATCESGSCVPFCSDAGCPLNAQGVPETCQANGACLQCVSSSDCPASQVCLPGGTCGACTSDSDCASDPDGGGAVCAGGTCNQCHLGMASDPLCPDAGACSGEGVCCASAPGLGC